MSELSARLRRQWDREPPDDVAWGWITPEQLVELEVAERRLADLYAAIVLAAEIIAYNRRASRAGGET